MLVVDIAGEDRRGGVLIHDVAPDGGVLDAVSQPHVLPDIRQLVGPHLTLLKGTFQSNNIPVLCHHVSVE